MITPRREIRSRRADAQVAAQVAGLPAPGSAPGSSVLVTM